jgi:hypothetical protein
MRLYLIICAAVLAGCGHKAATVPPDLLTPCPGWVGKTPATEGQLIRAALAEKAGRLCANGKLSAVAGVLK